MVTSWRGWVVAFLLALDQPALAQIVITIDEAPEGAEPIAIVPFQWAGTGVQPPEDIASIIAADLGNSGRFAPITRDSLPARPTDPSAIRWNDWKRLGMNNLVIGWLRQLTAPGPGARYEASFRLFDVLERVQLAGERSEIRRADLRKAAHQVSDRIYEALTGERGAFDTRIAYVTETSDLSGARTYALYVADSDGFNAAEILHSRDPIMSPAWSHDGRRLAYVSFEGGRPGIYVQDLRRGSRRRVSAYPGINGAPAWSPDDRRLALTLSKDGNPEIYVMHLASGVLRRITDNRAIDTEPAWSPDGGTLVFTSDRGGRPQLYRVPLAGGVPRRITLVGTSNARAAFAPDGKSLALVHEIRGRYRVGWMNLASGEIRVLSRGRLDESPSVSPNGRMVLYATTMGGVATLAAVSVDGRVRQRIAVEQGRVREPAWSPFRH